MKKSLYNLDVKDIEKLGLSKKYVGRQLLDWIYNKNIVSLGEITNISNKDLDRVKENYFLTTLKMKKVVQSKKDNTQKFLFQTHDGHHIESVLIADKKNEKYTLCLSSQVGCVFNCRFCATGMMKLKRSLKSYEIVEQYNILHHYSKNKIKNIVYMGMGEPFAIGDNLYESIDILCGQDKFGLGDRHISVSTIGLIDKIGQFTSFSRKNNLLISLHSAIQKKRNMIMPNMKLQLLKDLKKTILQYNKQKNKSVMLEYIMLNGINDGEEDIKALKNFVKNLWVKVNLISYNEVRGIPYKASSKETIHHFSQELKKYGIDVVQRYKKGDDIQAACGQLLYQ